MLPPTAAEVRAALEAIRTASALRGSPLLGLPEVSRRLHARGMGDEPASRAWLLTQWLRETTKLRLDALRGAPRIDRAAPTPQQELSAFRADFHERRLERHAWSVLYIRYFASSDMTVRELADFAAVSRKTLHRRLSDGYELLARALTPALPATQDPEPIPRGNLPFVRSSFIGRTRPLEALRDALRSSGFVTVAGPGGVGKSRLAIQAATRSMADYPDGVWWIDLAPVSAAQVDVAVAMALGLREEPDRPIRASLLSALRRRRLLLVVDNCEHVLATISELLGQVLKGCPNVHVLATSREIVRLEGEIVLDLGPLALPDAETADPREMAESEAVRLFVDRARAVSMDWAPEAQDWLLVADLCRSLDGLSLAIEMAAAGTRGLGLDAVSKVVDDHVRLLELRGLTTPERHRSLEAVLQWSYDLLRPAEQALLRALSVFRGPFSIAMIRALFPEPIGGEQPSADLVVRLVDKSLAVRVESAEGLDYRMLATVSAFARRELEAAGEAELLRDRHLAQNVAYAKEAKDALRGTEQAAWLRQTAARHADIVAGLEWAIEGRNVVDGVAVAVGLQRYWDVRGHAQEACAVLDQLRSLPDAASHAREYALASLSQGWLTIERDRQAARELLEPLPAVFDALGVAQDAMWARIALGRLHFELGDYDAARRAFEEAAVAAIRLSAAEAHVEAQLGLGRISKAKGSVTEAELLRQAERMLDLVLPCGDPWLRARCLNFHGGIAHHANRYDVAADGHREALTLFRRLGDDLGTVVSTYSLAVVEDTRGNPATAKRGFDQVLATSRRMGWQRLIGVAHNGIGVTSMHLGDLDTARSNYTEAVEIGRQRGDTHFVANALMNIGDVEAKSGRLVEAEAATLESLRLRRQLGEWGAANTIVGLAMITAGLEQPRRAAQLIGVAEGILLARGKSENREERDEREETVRLLKEAIGAEAFEAALAAGKTLDAEAGYAFALQD